MTTTTEPPAAPSDGPSLWREAAAAGAFVLCAALVGGAVAGGFTAVAASSQHGRGAVAEQWEMPSRSSAAVRPVYANPYSPLPGFMLGVWRGGRFGAAVAGLAVLCTAVPGAPRVSLRTGVPLIAVAALGTALLAVTAAGVGAALGTEFPNRDLGYVDGDSPSLVPGDAASRSFMAAAVGREALFWGGVGWSAFAALWLRAEGRRGGA